MSKFNIFPNRNIRFKSSFKTDEIEKILLENTFIGSRSTSHTTTKKFIGEVGQNGFEIISSDSPKHVLCVLSSKFTDGNSTQIEVDVKLHKAFRILFTIGTLVLGSLIFIFPPLLYEKLSQLLTFVIGITIIRFVFINFFFNRIAEDGINDLKNILKIQEVE
jgi:hypothetical protein